MRKLLSAGFHRLWKSRVFWLVLAGTLFSALVIFWSVYDSYSKVSGFSCTPEKIMFELVPLSMLFCPIFVSLFQGREYSDGTVRNKLIAGHRRRDIYCSGLIVNACACMLFLLAGFGLLYLLGAIFLDPGQTPAGTLLFQVLCSLAAVAAVSAACMLVAMSCQGKALGAVLALALMFVLFMGGTWLDSRLREGEMTSMGMIMREDGSVEWLQPEPNPLYISGPERTAMELVYDFLPMGQFIRSANGDFERIERWIPLSLAFGAVFTAGGTMIFKKKDIK